MGRGQGPTGRTGQEAEAFEAAARLASYFRGGGAPMPVPCSVLLDRGEVCYGEGDAVAWQYTQLEGVTYNHVRAYGGTASMHVAAAMGNRYRRRRAEQSAAFQWRNLGAVRLVVTSERIMLLHRGQWGTFTDHTGIRQVNPDPMQLRVALAVDGAPMTTFDGPFVPWMSVLLVRLLYGEVLEVVGTPGLPPARW